MATTTTATKTVTTPIQLPANFFAQLGVRLFSKTSWFFRVIQIAAAVLGILSKVLEATGSILPPWLSWLPSTVTQVSAIVALIIAQLPVSGPTTVTKLTATNTDKPS